MALLSKNRVNTGRQPEIDVLKAFCIGWMIMLHTQECLAETENLAYVISDYACTFSGAATFMICMGLGVRYSRHQSPKEWLARGWELLTVGQLLNLCRNALPNLMAWWATGEQYFIANSLLVIQADILSFAGLAFLLLAALKALRMPDGGVLGLGITLNLAAAALYGTVKPPESYLLSQLAGFFVVTDAESYFPLCSYFVFVAFGYWLGGVYLRIADKRRLSARVLAVCAPVCAAWFALRLLGVIPWLPEFNSYLQYILMPGPDAWATCLMTVVLLAVFSLLLKGGEAHPIAGHMSRHINQYYCVSYMFILPMQALLMLTRGELMPGWLLPTLYAVFVEIACYLIITWNERHLHFGIAKLAGSKRAFVFAAIWSATAAVVAYAYPRIEMFANVWNDYLL